MFKNMSYDKLGFDKFGFMKFKNKKGDEMEEKKDKETCLSFSTHVKSAMQTKEIKETIKKAEDSLKEKIDVLMAKTAERSKMDLQRLKDEIHKK